MSYLNDFVVTYLNNIIMYNNTKKKSHTTRQKDSSTSAKDKHSSECEQVRILHHKDEISRNDSRTRRYKNEF
jgi:hypothetical protein